MIYENVTPKVKKNYENVTLKKIKPGGGGLMSNADRKAKQKRERNIRLRGKT